MGPKKGRRVRKIDVSTESVTEFEFGDTPADIQQRRLEREAREREEAQHRREEETRRWESRAEETHLHEEGVADKKGPGQRKVTLKQRLEERLDHHRHDTRYGHMTNIYLTDVDKRLLWTL